MIERLSLVSAQTNGSFWSATAVDERPQATRPSWPSTTCVALTSRTRGWTGLGLLAGVMGVGTEDDRLALAGPGASEIGDRRRVLRRVLLELRNQETLSQE